MEPHWVSILERKPELDKPVQVLAVKVRNDIEYDRAKLTSRGWVSLTDTVGTQVVAWLESDRLLDAAELSAIPKVGIRIPV